MGATDLRGADDWLWRRTQPVWLWGLFLGWIGVVVVSMRTRGARQEIKREEEQREEEETGEDAETRKLRKFGLE